MDGFLMDAQDFIENTKALPFEWGVSDCTLWVADYVMETTGIDPAKAARGEYDSRISCRRYVIANGGLLNLWRKCMGSTGSKNCHNGVAIVRTKGQALGAIIVSGMAVVKAETGFLATTEFEIVEGWCV